MCVRAVPLGPVHPRTVPVDTIRPGISGPRNNPRVGAPTCGRNLRSGRGTLRRGGAGQRGAGRCRAVLPATVTPGLGIRLGNAGEEAELTLARRAGPNLRPARACPGSRGGASHHGIHSPRHARRRRAGNRSLCTTRNRPDRAGSIRRLRPDRGPRARRERGRPRSSTPRTRRPAEGRRRRRRPRTRRPTRNRRRGSSRRTRRSRGSSRPRRRSGRSRRRGRLPGITPEPDRRIQRPTRHPVRRRVGDAGNVSGLRVAVGGPMPAGPLGAPAALRVHHSVTSADRRSLDPSYARTVTFLSTVSV